MHKAVDKLNGGKKRRHYNEISLIHSERIDQPVSANKNIELPKVVGSIPSMTKEDKEENGEKNDEGNSKTETSS